MLSDRLPDSLITQKILQIKEQIIEIRRDKQYNQDDLIKLWYLKKNLIQLGDENELKTYMSHSRPEAVMYCRKMIRKIKNLTK